MNRTRFDTLLAISDVLILTACQRAHVRRRGRGAYVPTRDLHRAYEKVAVAEDRIDAALDGAWVLCTMLAHRHHLGVDVPSWEATLDGYTRGILSMSMPHSLIRLSPVLAAAVGVEIGGLRVAQ